MHWVGIRQDQSISRHRLWRWPRRSAPRIRTGSTCKFLAHSSRRTLLFVTAQAVRPPKLNTLKTNDLQVTPQGMLQLFCQEWKTLALHGRLPSQSKRMKGRYSRDQRARRLDWRTKSRMRLGNRPK